MSITSGIVETIGNTPLIRLSRASEATGCEILGKAEFMNPGQSVKDRTARQMILEAEARGDLRPGGLIVEGTAGNTGIGLALVAGARGYRTIIVIPETQSQEKKDMLRLAGAELVQVPAKPFRDPNNYQHVARRLAQRLRAEEPNGVLYADQWNNLDNRKAHFVSTGPEIWKDTGGKIDGFICSVGTGGTLAGASTYLREQNANIVIGCADPEGAAMYNLFTTGVAKATEGGSVAEGIGLGRVTPIVEGVHVDKAYVVPDSEALPVLFDLLEHEGLCLGGSSGINVAGAIRLAREMGPGHTIVTVLCDYGTRYQSKLYNPDFLRERKLPLPGWLEAAPRKLPSLFVEGGIGVTEEVFRDDAYARSVEARVIEVNDRGGIVLDRTVFYPTGGGQPGDRGVIETAEGRRIDIATTVYGEGREIVHVPAEPSGLAAGDTVRASIDWDLRYLRMRMHTCLHLLSAVLPYPVTGGQVGEDSGRLDFDIPDAGLDKEAITAEVNALIAGDHEVSIEWITDAELDAQLDLVKTMSVQPPRGTGRVRLIRIGDVDLQPCGGTHVAHTAEIGKVAVTKIEKKGAQNRRVRVAFA